LSYFLKNTLSDEELAQLNYYLTHEFRLEQMMPSVIKNLLILDGLVPLDRPNPDLTGLEGILVACFFTLGAEKDYHLYRFNKDGWWECSVRESQLIKKDIIHIPSGNHYEIAQAFGHNLPDPTGPSKKQSLQAVFVGYFLATHATCIANGFGVAYEEERLKE